MVDQLAAKARAADTEQALLFVVANDTHALLPYRTALVFTLHQGEPQLACASGLTSVDRRSAFGSWSEQVLKALLPQLGQTHRFTASDVPEALQQAWHEYWPEVVQLHPIAGSQGEPLGAVVYVSDKPWPDVTVPMLNALHQVHGLCLQNLRAQKGPLDFLKQLVDGRNLKTRKYLVRALVGLLLVLCLPVRQFVIAPAEIILLDSIAVTTPVEGIVAQMVARPNQPVKKGDVLVRLGEAVARAKRDMGALDAPAGGSA